MEWKKIRQFIPIGVSNNKNSEVNFKIRTNTIAKYKGVCRFCGGQFQNSLKCFIIDDEFDICCKFCFALTNINLFADKLVLIKSNISQTKIIRLTVDFTLQNKTIPPISYIDPDAKLVQLSVYEVSSLFFSDNHNQWNEFNKNNKFKFVFNKNFNLSFLSFNKFIQVSLFDSDDDSDNSKNDHEKIKKYKFNHFEYSFLSNFFKI